MSKIVSHYLGGLKGIEIGRGSQNIYEGVDGLNIDCKQHALFDDEQLKYGAKEIARIDIIADAHKIPLGDDSQEYVFSSHVFEHLCDPIAALEEWYRLVRKDGYVALIIPQRDAAPSDKGLPLTIMQELVDMHEHPKIVEDTRGHLTRWDVLLFCVFVSMGEYLKWWKFDVVNITNPDDKIGNGFLVILKVIK